MGRRLSAAFLLAMVFLLRADELPDITTLPEDLKVPAISDAAPSCRACECSARRARLGSGTVVHHTLSLPVNWKPGAKISQCSSILRGMADSKTNFSDVCEGTVEGCNLAFGISGGRDYICIAMPFVKVTGDGKRKTPRSGGAMRMRAAAYCVATVRQVCREFGGDEKAVVLCGFSRGSIACNFIGLRNDTIAPLWRAFICHSHYDGVRTTWPYADADRVSALARLQRLNGRPQFISQEGTVEDTRRLSSRRAKCAAAFEYSVLPFRNHTDRWALRDCEQRRKVRAWLRSLGLPAP